MDNKISNEVSIFSEIMHARKNSKNTIALGFDFALSLDLAIPKQKSIKLNGRSTCLRLEKIYWVILDGIAKKNKISITKLLSEIEIKSYLNIDNIKNFSGLIRVICVSYILNKNAYLSE